MCVTLSVNQLERVDVGGALHAFVNEASLFLKHDTNVNELKIEEDVFCAEFRLLHVLDFDVTTLSPLLPPAQWQGGFWLKPFWLKPFPLEISVLFDTV